MQVYFYRMAQVSIIIPTLFPPPHLLAYAEKIKRYSGVREVTIVINDVLSVLASAENSTVKVIALGQNKGFTGACNAGARASTGDMLLFLNDDCEMDEENFMILVDFLEKNPTFAATQPIVFKESKEQSTQSKVHKAEYIKQRTQNKLHLEDEVIENVGFTVDARVGKAHAVQDVAVFQDKQFLENNLYGLSGTCLLIRAEIFRKVGMWDESFHSYLEDVDLSLRMRKFHYECAPCLTASVTHAHMGTSRRMGMYKPMQDMKNWWRLIVKHPQIFVHMNSLIPLLLERGKNVNGIIKKSLVPRA